MGGDELDAIRFENQPVMSITVVRFVSDELFGIQVWRKLIEDIRYKSDFGG
jgi:hypothetical protein